MLGKYLMAGVMLAALTAPACAWTAKTGGSGPQAIGQDGGSATAQAQHQRQHQSQTATGGISQSAGGAGGAGGRGGNARSTGGSTGAITNNLSASNGGGGDYNRTASSAYASDLPAGPCTGVGTTVGVSLPFIGGTGAHAEPDQVCQLHMIGHDQAAKEFLCRTNKDIRAAFISAGEPCSADMPKAHLAMDVNDGKNDYCFTRHAGDKNQHLECDRFRREFP